MSDRTERPDELKQERERPALIRPGGLVDPQAIRIAAAMEDEGETDDDGLRRVTFKLTRDLNKRLDRYLTDRIPFMSRNQLQRLIDLGGVTVNARIPKASTRLRLGDEVVVVVPPPPARDIQAEQIPLDIVFEDETLIVINKSPDIIVHPARSHHSGTLLNALVWHFQNVSQGALSDVGREAARPGVVHRLDRKTSGVMVVAKDDEAHWRLGRQFEERQVDKRYLALVEGEIESVADVIELPIGPHPSRAKGMREKMVVRHDSLGKPAVTLYRVRERFVGYTLLELELKTGRTHQIRVHLSHLGYPLVGDDMYGGQDLLACHIHESLGETVILNRQALHAATLGFRHPMTRQQVQFSAPLPDDLQSTVRMLRAHRSVSGPLQIPGATIDLDAIMPG